MPPSRTKAVRPPDICLQFGEAVRLRRTELQLTQEELAAKAHVHRTYVGDLERGARNVALRNIQKIAAALELSAAEFFVRYEIGSQRQGPQQ